LLGVRLPKVPVLLQAVREDFLKSSQSFCGRRARRNYDARVNADTGATRILVVEDELAISEPLVGALAREGFDATVARTGREALSLAERFEPHLVLLDLMLPDADGRDICRDLRRRSDVAIIMLTARGTETDRVVGLELGADDYVVKPFSSAELIARIRAILRRSAGRREDAAVAVTIGELAVDEAARRVTIAGAPVDLTRKEFDLLARLVRDAGRVVRREDLMSEVWDENWFGSTKTLDVHISSLRRKLADDPEKPRYVHTARGVGFRFASPQELAP